MITIFSYLVFIVSLFPSSENISSDPSGRYQLRWEEASELDPHRLFIKSSITKREEFVRAFNRHIQVSWSPTGNQFAVTDFEGSDSSRVYIYQSNAVLKTVEIRKQIPDVLVRYLDGNHHSYLKFVSWKSDGEILLSVSSYGDVGNLDQKVSCNLDKDVWTCKKK
jgi:hypothetical protein